MAHPPRASLALPPRLSMSPPSLRGGASWDLEMEKGPHLALEPLPVPALKLAAETVLGHTAQAPFSLPALVLLREVFCWCE